MKFNKKELLCFILSIVSTAAVFFTAGAFTADFLEHNRIASTIIEYVPQTSPSTTETTFTTSNSVDIYNTQTEENSTTNSAILTTTTTLVSTTHQQNASGNSSDSTYVVSKTIVMPIASSSTSHTTSTTRTVYTTPTTTQTITETTQTQTQSSSATNTSVTVGKINLNTATKEELMTIKGIGEVYANRIIEYRELIGYFTCIEELLEVKGIGEKRLAQWAPYLTV